MHSFFHSAHGVNRVSESDKLLVLDKCSSCHFPTLLQLKQSVKAVYGFGDDECPLNLSKRDHGNVCRMAAKSLFPQPYVCHLTRRVT